MESEPETGNGNSDDAQVGNLSFESGEDAKEAAESYSV
jgi:hypothetical protein